MRKTLASLATLLAFATPAIADGPVVVELYTSQGCSSCPPADEMLQDLSKRTDVIALALHVDYWDYIGWADGFADPDYTTRQQDYARMAGVSSIYTPQMVIGGQDHVLGAKAMEVADLIHNHMNRSGGARIEIQRSGEQLHITGSSSAAFSGDALVQVVRYSPEETVEITHGENEGRSIRYVNIVTDWRVVGQWDGRGDLDMTVPMSGAGPVVVIVQDAGPGAVLASALLR